MTSDNHTSPQSRQRITLPEVRSTLSVCPVRCRWSGCGLDADEFEAEVTDPVEQAVQVGLVEDRPGDRGPTVLDEVRHAFEGGPVASAQLAADDDLVSDRRVGALGFCVASPCQLRCEADETTSSTRWIHLDEVGLSPRQRTTTSALNDATSDPTVPG
jgi:hypothetical protein